MTNFSVKDGFCVFCAFMLVCGAVALGLVGMDYYAAEKREQKVEELKTQMQGPPLDDKEMMTFEVVVSDEIRYLGYVARVFKNGSCGEENRLKGGTIEFIVSSLEAIQQWQKVGDKINQWYHEGYTFEDIGIDSKEETVEEQCKRLIAAHEYLTNSLTATAREYQEKDEGYNAFFVADVVRDLFFDIGLR